MAARRRWNEKFEELRQFRDDHGRWPKAREGALGMWSNTQRQAKKGHGGRRISPAQIAKLDGIGFDWNPTMPPKEPAEPAGPAAELQQQKMAVPPRKRVHEADPEGSFATCRATGPHALPMAPMAASAAFSTATPVAVAPDAGSTATPDAGAPVSRERAWRSSPLRATAFDDGSVIKI